MKREKSGRTKTASTASFPGKGIVLFWVCLLALFPGMMGCSGTGAGEQVSGDGQVVIGLTDKQGDFVSYTIDVVSLTLMKADGAVVETLPLRTRVDFASYTEMTEFLTAATVPGGVYTRVRLTLDYQDADIWVEDAAGEPVKAGAIEDVYGNKVSTLQVSVRLEDMKALLVAPGVPAHLTLDFDLSASNHVRFPPGDSPVVTVRPVLLAEVNPQAPKIHRLRGPLTRVDAQRGVFEVMIRPFVHSLPGKNSPFGSLVVMTDDQTLYDHSGEHFQGPDGLSAMQEFTPFTATVVIGDLRFRPPRFEAREVRTGASVPGGALDVVNGNVTRREGDLLTVQGATLIRAGGSMVFNDQVTVPLGEDTIVRKQFSNLEQDIGDISVGQHITVAGTLVNDDPGALELDATRGHVHMEITAAMGSVADVESDLVMDLNSIDRRRIEIFDFSGTGEDPEHDADPENYEVDTGTLDTSFLATGIPVKALGFVTPFGQAPVDFEARSLVNVMNVPALLTVGWDPASGAALEEISATGITLDMDGVGPFHFVDRAGVLTDLLETVEAPRIRPVPGGPGVYEIVEDASHWVHTSFAQFAVDLEERIAGEGAVKHIIAAGAYDHGTAILTAGRVSVEIQ